ncbi:protoporphyrinogen oxidase HemJ [Campylobacter geochelonis]|uniref:Protoporphyrinogen IX oxidase n=1 Tax=Campylobacter geochelonis TaxID=1780362 RepID=A0A128EE66_9BACT|nr:protoporphyrinogen oxidase HemJ [Campylobacter geochelonis]QKF70662.1 UPF0093 domain-containing membrane protein [Campylobacter geochelonis]CZE45834.1 flagellin [Campylobacter geochelonis]CZE46807.1 flagellin [Campylobacter geochelonis]CZE50293.1 flagellin [Campylobacter geochelonis]
MDYYIYIKYFHYLAFISWMALLFYQPRLYVYHMEHIDNPGFVKVVKIQEDKLYNFIGWPAMLGSLISGIVMIILNPALMQMGHIHVKLTVVFLMLLYHFDLGRYLKQLREDRCTKSGKFFRFYNEVPTIAMLIIIWIMIVNPF